MTTSIYFVRHAQPDASWEDDRTRPLTPQGVADTSEVLKCLSGVQIDHFYSSPYERSRDTILASSRKWEKEIRFDERFRERKQGKQEHVSDSGYDMGQALLKQRWDDFKFCEEGGECLGDLQRRNIEAVKEILRDCKDKNVVVGTHISALCSIINYFFPEFGYDDNLRLWDCMPSVIRLEFEGEKPVGKEELLTIPRGY